MNTKAFQEQVANLKSADIAAYRANTKSNLLLNFVRGELLKRAYKEDKKLTQEVTVEMSMTVASYIMPSLALLSKEGQYPALFSNAIVELDDGAIKLHYVINAEGLSDEYREKLNKALDIDIPMEACV